MVKNERIYVKINEELMLLLKDLKTPFGTWEKLLDYLCKSTEVPKSYQKNYQLNYKSGDKMLFNVKVENKTISKFKSILKYFKNQEKCLDYLVFKEKSKVLGFNPNLLNN